MHDARVGRVLRALRRRRRWRQADLAARAGVAQTTISRLERGHVAQASVAVLRRVFVALDASLELEPRWRGGTIDRLLDERHATLVAFTVRILRSRGWEVAPEVTYAVYGERGSIDVLAIDRRRGALLVVEVKSEILSLEAMLRTLDTKVRLAPGIGLERYAVRSLVVSRLVVAPADATVARRVRAAAGVLESALPARGWQVRRWLHDPVGRLDGLWLVSPSTLRAARRVRARPSECGCRAGRPPRTGRGHRAPREARQAPVILSSSHPGAG